MSLLIPNKEAPIAHLSCGLFQTEEDWRHMSRVIDSAEIILGLKGIVHLEQAGRTFDVEPGTFLLLLPGLLHRGVTDSTGETSFYWMHFPLPEGTRVLPSVMPSGPHDRNGPNGRNSPHEWNGPNDLNGLNDRNGPNDLNGLQDIPNDSIVLPEHFRLPFPEKPGILFRQLLHTANAGYRNPHACDYLLTLILIEMSQQYLEALQTAQSGIGRHSRMFSEMVEWIRVHLTEPFTLGEVARRFGFSEDYLTRLFKRQLGTGFVRYVNGQRLSRARNLLSQTWFGIKEIAWQCGFPDEKYFMRLFRDEEGMTPTAYRNAYHRTHVNNV